jgi:hypothetical protein
MNTQNRERGVSGLAGGRETSYVPGPESGNGASTKALHL